MLFNFFSIRSLLHFDDFLVSNQAVGFFDLHYYYFNCNFGCEYESTILSKLGHIQNLISYA